jgi:hypothetical protein
MIFFKRNYAVSSSLHIEDFIPTPEFQSLLPKHQKFLKKLFDNPSQHLEKFVSKISTNGILISHDILEKMIDQLYLESQIPLQAFSLETIKNVSLPNLKTENSPFFEFWIELNQKLKIWDKTSIPEHTMFNFFRIIDQMLVSDYQPEFGEHTPSKTFWKSELAFPEITAFKFLFEKFKYFHSEQIIQSKRPMDLFELYCLFEDAAYAQNLVQSSSDHLDFLRALNASALIYTTLKLFPAAIPDFMANLLDNHPQYEFQDLNFLKQAEFDIFYGKHALIEKLNLTCFYYCLNIWILSGLSADKKTQNLKPDIQLIKGTLQSQEIYELNSIAFQNMSKRLIFIFNRLTTLGYLLRSPILKGLGYNPLIHTELPKKFSEQFPQIIQTLQELPHHMQLQVIQETLQLQPNLIESYETKKLMT